MCIYPDSMLRGIPNDNYIGVENGEYFAKFNLYYEGDRRNISVNWEDDNTVLDFTLGLMKNNGEVYRYKFGAARLYRQIIDDYIERKGRIISYDHKEDPDTDNNYHGNLNILTENDYIFRSIAFRLAEESEIIPRE